MPRHSTWCFSRSSCRTTPCDRSAAASRLSRRSFPSAAAKDRLFWERSSPAAAGSSLRGSAAFLSSALASPVAVLWRTVVGLRRSSCATFAAVAGGTPSRAHRPTAAAASAAAAPSADCGSFQATLPPPSLRTPDEACHTAAVLTAVTAASAPGPAAAVRRAPTSGNARCGWERLPSFCVEGFPRSPVPCCSVHRLPFFARSPLSLPQKIEDMRTATRPPVRVLTVAEVLRGEVVSSAFHTSRLRSPATKLNRLHAGSSRSNAFCTYTDFSFPRRESQCASPVSRRCYVCCSPLRVYLCPSSVSKMPFAHSYSIRGAGEAFQPAVLGIATFATARNAGSFDIFQRLKDPPDVQQRDDAEAAATGKKRKPSDRVLHLVDEIMNLTLIEAADLCDLCQEKLVERSGGPAFSAVAAAGRTPFPHPAAMFAGMGMPGMMPTAMPAMGVASPVASAPGAGQPSAPQASPAVAEPAKTPEKKEEVKATFSIKLMGFDAAKKVAVVKEVRAITALGLRESKDLVEQAPKIVKKGVPAAEAEALKKKLEAAGAQVALE